MNALDLALIALLVLAPIAVLGPLTKVERGRRSPFVPGLWSIGLGAVAFGVSRLVLHGAARTLGIAAPSEQSREVVGIAFALLVVGPVEESLRVAASVPGFRSKRLRRPYDAMRVAIGTSLGFASCETARRLLGDGLTTLGASRALMDLVGHVALSSLWGFSLGRRRQRTVGGGGFTRAFLTAVVLGGLASHLVFARGPSALFAAGPLIGSLALLSLIARRDLLRMGDAAQRKRGGLPARAPSILELENALLTRPDRPVKLTWIGLGALVTIGVLTTMLAGSVALGHQAGVDFAAVDQTSAFERSAPPLVLLGTAALAAFPVSGFLVARASAAGGVLEPALGASVAILGIVVLLGLAAPVAVVFGLALAPLAFAAACVGAWAGLER